MPVSSPVVTSPILAHRGASDFAPENTLRAVEVAAERGAAWIETDVRLTADGRLVIIHDETLDRTTDGAGFVCEHTLAQIRTLDAGAWFAAAFAGQKVPTLEEYLALIQALDLSLQLELKPMRGREEELAERVVEALGTDWDFNSATSKLFLASSSERSLSVLASRLPDVPRALALHYLPRDPERLAKETGVQILHVKDAFLTAETLARIARTPLEIAVATVNDPARARFLIAHGVQSVLSDDPGLLRDDTSDTRPADPELSALRTFEAIMGDAGAVALARFAGRTRLGTRLKGTRDLVSDADIEIEKMLRDRLTRAFDVADFLGEEGGGHRSRSYWCVDPIDGTANFVAGLPSWGLSAALIRDGALEMAVICLPLQNTVLSAKAGAGAYRNGVRLDKPRSAGVATFALGDSRAWEVAGVRAVENDAHAAGYDIVKYRCSVASLGAVILGQLDGYCECSCRLWDAAAGALIAREAGLACDLFVEPEGTLASIVCGARDLCERLVDHVPDGQTQRL